MKKHLFLFILMLLPILASAQTVSDVQNSGCISEKRADVTTIVLTKEGSTLSVQLLNYESNCGTTDFSVTPKIITDEGETCYLTVDVDPVIPDGGGVWCVCPFNVSFTVRDLEPNSFYLDCLWHKGLVELTEGETLMLEYIGITDVKINETTFPDSNFRNWVLSQDYGSDGVLTNEELENVTSLDLSRLEIHDLKGIEYFFALKALNCMTNKLTTLDLSNNIALEKLNCLGNRLTTINLQENKKLRYLSCVSNQLTALDISGCTELDTLACSNNQLTALDVSMNTKLISLECYGNQLSALDLSKNTALRRIHCNDNQLTSLDVSKNTALTMLQCSSNLLTTLDVTKNSAMTSLSCTNNKLTTLHVSNNKSLESIICFHNQLTSLDMSGCSALIILDCSYNQLTSLELSGCSALEGLGCNDNQLTTLDLSENTALTMLYCYHNQIKGAGMDALVESLPTVSEGSLKVMYFENEQNVMTTTQVATAKAKGWTPHLCTYSFFEEYAGSETNQDDYRPFVEEGKVWKVGNCQAILENSVQVVDYYYFDGDTIIGGKTCKQMMCQRFVSPDFSDEYGYWTPIPFLRKVGAWYEEDQKVYFYDEITQSMVIKYDFSLGDNETVDFLNVDGYPPYIIGPKQTGGIKGFKGVYRDIMMGQDINTKTPWLEGVGGLDGPFASVYHPLADSTPDFLMSCVVGDEVIYYNDDREDAATPAGARKNRFDFTHTPKIQPKTRISRGEEPLDLWSLATNGTQESVYGEYNDLQLGINLDPLDDAYLVSITNDSGKVVYEKTINAGNIVGLNIDISAYAKGRYTVTVENSRESFTGEFETLTTGISDAVRLNDNGKMINDKHIYNLQGQRLSRLQKGLNIVNGKKIYIK